VLQNDCKTDDGLLRAKMIMNHNNYGKDALAGKRIPMKIKI
jgi:hypothetical protein